MIRKTNIPIIRGRASWSAREGASIFWFHAHVYAQIFSNVSQEPVHSACPSLLTPRHDTRFSCALWLSTFCPVSVSQAVTALGWSGFSFGRTEVMPAPPL